MFAHAASQPTHIVYARFTRYFILSLSFIIATSIKSAYFCFLEEQPARWHRDAAMACRHHYI